MPRILLLELFTWLTMTDLSPFSDLFQVKQGAVRAYKREWKENLPSPNSGQSISLCNKPPFTATPRQKSYRRARSASEVSIWQ